MVNNPGKKSLLPWGLLVPGMYSGEKWAEEQIMIDYAVLMEENG